MGNCSICFNSSTHERISDAFRIKCRLCGTFVLTGTAVTVAEDQHLEDSTGKPLLGPMGHQRRKNLSAWLFRNQGQTLDSVMIHELAELPTPSVLNRIDQMLRLLSENCDSVGRSINLGEEHWIPGTYSADRHEVIGLAKILRELGRIEFDSDNISLTNIPTRITGEGWRHLEKLEDVDADSVQGFVAMWFRPSLNRLYDEAIAPAIDSAGFDPLRIDRKQHIEKIDDQIVAEIRRSRFLVADYTGHRGGVYWEAGFAAGIGIPVVMTCCKRHMKDIHFDIRQYNCIDWVSRDELRNRLENRVRAVIGHA